MLSRRLWPLTRPEVALITATGLVGRAAPVPERWEPAPAGAGAATLLTA